MTDQQTGTQQGGQGNTGGTGTDTGTKPDAVVDVKVEAPATGADTDTAKALKAAEAEAEKFKNLARKHEDRAKDNAAKAKQFDELQAANASEQEKAVKAAQEETEKSVSAKFLKRIAESEVRAAAGGRLADPSDAVRMLSDVASFVSDDGEADQSAITKAIDDLLAAKPYLAPAGTKPASVNLDAGTRPGVKVDTSAPGMDRMKNAYRESRK